MGKILKACCMIWNAEFIRLDRQIHLASTEDIAPRIDVSS
jgi:hypothetical protein